MNSYNSSFSCGFLFDVKPEKANVWGPLIILIVVRWEQPHPNGVMLNLSLYLKSLAWRTFFFFFHVNNNNNKKNSFFFSVVVVFFYQMCISCTSLWLVERSLVFVSETFSIRFFYGKPQTGKCHVTTVLRSLLQFAVHVWTEGRASSGKWLTARFFCH